MKALNLPILTVVALILSWIVTSCKSNPEGPYDINDFKKYGYYRIDARSSQMHRPLNEVRVIIIPESGIDTTIYYDYPGMLFNLFKICPDCNSNFENDLYNNATVDFIDLKKWEQLETIIPHSYTKEPYTWEYRPTSVVYDEISARSEHPLSLRLKVSANDTGNERRYRIEIVEAYYNATDNIEELRPSVNENNTFSAVHFNSCSDECASLTTEEWNEFLKAKQNKNYLYDSARTVSFPSGIIIRQEPIKITDLRWPDGLQYAQ